MNVVIIPLASMGTALLAGRLSHQRPVALADLLIGLIGGLIGLSVAQFFGPADTLWSLGLPLLVACGLTLGLSRPDPAQT
jgi:hypothetical protein